MTRWRTLHHGSRSDRGAVAVEFAIVLTVLMLILFGIIDFGRLLYVNQAVKAASREGARVGVVSTAQAGTILDRTKAAASGAQALSGSPANSVSVEGAVCSTSCDVASNFGIASPGWPLGTTTGTTLTTATPCGTAEAIRVTVRVPFSWFTPVALFASSVNQVVASTTMRCE